MTLALSTCRDRPERGSSCRPASPLPANRPRHAITVGWLTPTRSAIAVFDNPCPASSTILARCARPAETLDDRVGRSSSTRSASPIRASWLNGCAHCLEMRTKDAHALGEDDDRIHLVAAWREAQ